MYEIGFMLFNRPSIFFISFVIMFNSFGLMLIYFIVFGDTFSSLMVDLTNSVTPNNFFGKRCSYVIILTGSLIPMVIKKELQVGKIAKKL